jgi:hypothetical protein
MASDLAVVERLAGGGTTDRGAPGKVSGPALRLSGVGETVP